jgi:hypothetical protein
MPTETEDQFWENESAKIDALVASFADHNLTRDELVLAL